MSGITGIFRRDGKDVDPADIKKMNDKIAHRGPDGSRVWCEGPVALGHQMLHTTPESLHETLPFEDEESGLVITADARIDNRKDLAPRLGIEDNEYVSDSCFILKAYEKWGETCPEELLGDFAFAIWDRTKEQLFCARDHMGVKPFYYYLDDDFFIFATEIKALTVIAQVPVKLNKLKMADYLCLLPNDEKITFYDDIFSLPSANVIIINLDNNHKYKYWELDVNREIKMDSDQEYADAFLKIFNEAVNCRLRSAFPVGSLLSGGLDSSSIVCTARKTLSAKDKQHLRTYSATFEETIESDERYYINKVINMGDLIPSFIEADKLSPLYGIDDILEYCEEPHFAVNFYFHWNIHQRAKQDGVRVILEGFDGDTTLSHGEKFLIDYFKSFHWIKGIKEFSMHSERVKNNVSKKEFLISFFLHFIPGFIIDLLRLLPFFPSGRMGTYNFVNLQLAEETDVKVRIKRYENQYRSASSTRAFHYFSLHSGFQHFLAMINKSAAASHADVRFPFFDKRLVEFCLALPLEQKIHNGWTRIIMRRAMEDILPVEIQWRPDKGMLGPNFRKNFILFEKDLIEDVLFNRNHLIKDYVNLDMIYKMYDKYKSGEATNVFLIFSVVVIGIWIQEIFNKTK